MKRENLAPDNTKDLSTYRYEAYRPRYDHETPNYWKWEEQEITELDELRIKVKDLKEKNQELDSLMYKMETKENEQHDIIKAQKKVYKDLNESVIFNKKDLLQYGTHKNDCVYWDLVNSGRTIPNMKDKCSCGWLEAKVTTEMYIDLNK